MFYISGVIKLVVSCELGTYFGLCSIFSYKIQGLDHFCIQPWEVPREYFEKMLVLEKYIFVFEGLGAMIWVGKQQVDKNYGPNY